MLFAAWLGWTMAFDFTGCDHASDSRDIQRIDHGCDVCVYNHAVDARPAGVGLGHGAKTPWMIAILGYSLCNFAWGLTDVSVPARRAVVLGLFMGAEWPAMHPGDGAAAVPRVHQRRAEGSWGLGFLCLHADLMACSMTLIGWRDRCGSALLVLAVVYVRYFVKRPEVW